jgi:hypothetical protein
LAGGATVAAGRLVAEDGVLKVQFIGIFTWKSWEALAWGLIFTTKTLFKLVMLSMGYPWMHDLF